MVKVLAPALAGLLLAAPAAAPRKPAFTLSSPAFANNGPLSTVNEGAVPASGCNGGNEAPTLTWSGAPAGTRGFALYMYDADAKLTHWFVYNIPASVHRLTAVSAPTYTLGATSFGKATYVGPCPPVHAKAHHYYFTLIALKVAHVKAPPGTALTFAQFVRATRGQWIRHTALVGTFQRP